MAAQNAQDAPWTVARLLAWTREHFERQQIESPRLCAEILLAHALGCPRIQLFTQYERVPDANALAGFREHVKAAAGGTPVAYLVGSKEFFSLPLKVGPDVLIPRPETEILVERAIALVRKGEAPAAPAILDVGTGSGCIAIALARHLREARLIAVDISAAALRVAAENAVRHEVNSRVEFVLGDCFDHWTPADPQRPTRFDIIVSNPPYIAQNIAATLPRNVRDFEPHAALFGGVDGLEVIRRLIVAAPQHLRCGGHLLMEVAYDQAEAVRGLLPAASWHGVETFKDGGGHPRVVHAVRCALEQAEVA
ncbi:Release factor glutamine methyltransferase [Phycisphaerae bacterium RAS1]|nr:Release factor glutamine methyltransferase [Phycisphaerae bacterium RAS1]